MNITLRGGFLIGILCGIWMYVVGFAGWYRDPVLQAMFWVVVPLQVGVLVWALRHVPDVERTYGSLVKKGVFMSLIGGAIIIAASLLFTTVVFPDYFEELRTVQAEMLRAGGMGEEQIAAEQAAMAPMENPVVNSLMGFVGTVMTGGIAALLIAVFLRKKSA